MPILKTVYKKHGDDCRVYLLSDFMTTIQQNRLVDYQYFGTAQDDKGNLENVTKKKLDELALGGAQVAGQMALRLVHDHILKLDVTKYTVEIGKYVNAIVGYTNQLKNAKVTPFLSNACCIKMPVKVGTSKLTFSVFSSNITGQ